MIERGFGRWEEQSCSRDGLRLEKMLTDCHSGTRLAFYGAPAVVGVLLFANGIPRVQRDILQVRQQNRQWHPLIAALTPSTEGPLPR